MSNNNASSYTVTGLTRTQMLRQLDRFATTGNTRGVLLALRDVLLYWVSVAVILMAPWLAVKVVASVLLGFRLSSSYTLAHDAAHRALVKSPQLNWALSLLLGIPSCQNYRMWVADHNLGHHPKTNAESVDFYRPLSKEEYDRMSRPRQLLERFIRAPNVVGLWFNFMFRWLLPLRIHPTDATLPRNRKQGWVYFAVMAAYHSAFVGFLVHAATFAPISAPMAVLLAWFLPLCVHCFMSGMSLYLMHNNRRIPWFKESADRREFPPELCSTHLVQPKWLSVLFNHVYCHAVHHAHAGIPCYNLYDAQQELNRHLGAWVVIEDMSLRNIVATMKACKLYDYENHQWLDFDGRPTAPPIRLTPHSS